MIQLKQNAKVACCLALLGVSLFGCTDRVSLAEQKMAAIQQEPAQPIEPPPVPEPIEDYIYQAHNVRSPFVAQSLIEMQAKLANTPSIKPDENRIKHELENYELSELVYRGRVEVNGKPYGLVQTPDNLIREVQVNDYMGKDHGRIVEITPTQINLIEIVEDARLGYVEKSANLISP